MVVPGFGIFSCGLGGLLGIYEIEAELARRVLNVPTDSIAQV
jgi:hypothetical protein